MYQSKNPYMYGTGRRKSSVARVHLFPNGTGKITINGRDIDEYFGLETLKMVVRQPLNTTNTLGKVDIKGVDVEAEATLEPVHDWLITARVQYTYQDARDVTDERDAYYRDQIPYIPWHSGSAILGLHHRQWDFNYSFIYAGERYNAQENTLYNHMQPWYTSDLSLMYGFNVGKTLWRLTLEVNNVFDQNYDVIANYPMPGRNFGVSAELRF